MICFMFEVQVSQGRFKLFFFLAVGGAGHNQWFSGAVPEFMFWDHTLLVVLEGPYMMPGIKPGSHQ